jgi:hypothetical protein
MSSTSASTVRILNIMIGREESTMLHSSIDFGAARNCRDLLHSAETKDPDCALVADNKKGKRATRPLPFSIVSIP